MAKGRKLNSPSDDPDLAAMKKRLSYASNHISSTPLTPSSPSALTPPTKTVTPPAKKPQNISKVPSSNSSSRKPKAKDSPNTTGSNSKVDGQIRVSQDFDSQVRKYAEDNNLSVDRLISAVVREAKQLLTTDHILTLSLVSKQASANFDAFPPVSWKRYNYSVSPEVLERSFKLCGDIFKQSPATAYSCSLSAAVVHAFKSITSR